MISISGTFSKRTVSSIDASWPCIRHLLITSLFRKKAINSYKFFEFFTALYAYGLDFAKKFTIVPTRIVQQAIFMKNPLWIGDEVSSIVQGQGSTSWVASGVSIDTRSLKSGDLFIALDGPRFKGSHFIPEALSKGACAVITDHDFDPSTISGNILHVQNTLEALTALGRRGRQRFQGQVFAVTGTVGKTTVKEGLFHALSPLDSTFASLGSFNNHIGVPLSLCQLPPDISYGIFELGMNHAGEIATLVNMVSPHVSMITNVSYHHGVNFPSLDHIVQAKAEIFTSIEHLRAGILNKDSPHYQRIRDLSPHVPRWITFGSCETATVRLIATEPQGDFLRVTVSVEGTALSYTLPNGGPHWVINSLAILTASYALGTDVKRVCQNFATFLPPAGRGRRYTIGDISVIDDSYNAAYEAVVAALNTFSQDTTSKGRKFVFLGEMSELGDQTEYYHQALYDPLMSLNPEGIWLCGPSFESLALKLPNIKGYALTCQELIPHVLTTLCPGDALLVKGSRGIKTFAVIDALYRHYGMTEEALNYPLRRYL